MPTTIKGMENATAVRGRVLKESERKNPVATAERADLFLIVFIKNSNTSNKYNKSGA